MFYTLNAFKGINEAVDESLLTNEASLIVNGSVRDGALTNTKKPLLIPDYIPLPGMQTLMVYYKNEQQILLAATNDKIYQWDGSAWTEIMGGFSSGKFDYINDNVYDKDVIIFTNGIDHVKIWDGLGVRNVKKDGENTTESDENVAPNGLFLSIHDERLVIADSQNLYFSSVTANNAIDVDDFTCPTSPESEVNNHGAQIFLYSNTGDEIKGLAELYDDIIIFKEKHVYRIVGSSPSQYTKVELFNASGAIADKSIISTPVGAFFIHDGIYCYDGSSMKKISQKIDTLWDTIDKDHISEAIAAYFDHRYILSVKRYVGSDKDLIIEYDTLTGEFTTREGINAISFVEFAGELLFCDNQGQLYRYDRGDDALMQWEGGVFTAPQGAIDLEQVKIFVDGAGSLKITAETEKKTKEKTINITSETTKIVQMTCSGRAIKFKIQSLSGNIKVKKLFAEYSIDED